MLLALAIPAFQPFSFTLQVQVLNGNFSQIPVVKDVRPRSARAELATGGICVGITPHAYALLSLVKKSWGAKYGYGPKQIISETGTLRSETFIFRNIVP